MYHLIYHQQAVKQLKKLPWRKGQQVVEKLKKLADDPFLDELNIKKLAGTSRSYRLRIGDIRVIYEVDQMLRTVFIWKVGFRGQIY